MPKLKNLTFFVKNTFWILTSVKHSWGLSLIMFEQLLVGIKISVHCEENLHLEYIKSHEFLHHREEKCVTLNRECVSVVNCTRKPFKT